MVNTGTLKSTEGMVFARVWRGGSAAGVTESGSSGFSLLVSVNTNRPSVEKDGSVRTTSTLKLIEKVVSAGLVEKDEPNMGIAKNSFFDSSN